MKYLTIKNLDKLNGKIITARYRKDISQPMNSLSASFYIHSVEDKGDWIWVVCRETGNDSKYVQFRIHKALDEGGYVKVEKRHKMVEEWVKGDYVIGESWECRIPVGALSTPETLAYTLSTTGWDWDAYVTAVNPPLNYSFGHV